MNVIRPLLVSAVAMTAGTALAHDGGLLAAHSHPHLGAEHLLLAAAAGALLLWLVRAARR